ncbi:MAG: CoA-binding protein [Bacteroidales bacterium]|jgi:predicted CoA-binding protein|nr:CoA-binding protein [Bacteroidales bacterium]
MAKNSLTTIKEFTETRRFALVGLSRDPKKFSRSVFKELTQKGYQILPVNPNMDDVEGVKCYHDLSELPGDVKHALFMTPKAQTATEVSKAISLGMTHLWLQQGTETREAADLAAGKNIKLVNGACIMMHTNPAGVHNFHRFLSKIFGTFPKN